MFHLRGNLLPGARYCSGVKDRQHPWAVQLDSESCYVRHQQRGAEKMSVPLCVGEETSLELGTQLER